MAKKPNRKFDSEKNRRRLESIGKNEAEITPGFTLDSLEDAITEQPRVYSYQKTLRGLFRHLKLDATVFFCAILNIRKRKKKSKQSNTNASRFRKDRTQAARQLTKAIKAYPTLAHGWFRLSQEELLRELYITRKVEVRLMEVLRDSGLIMTIVCGMPKKRWCRVNYKRLVDLLDVDLEYEDDEVTT